MKKKLCCLIALVLALAIPTYGNQRLMPSDLEYVGAFRLPGGDDPPLTFAYGGNAMTFNPNGDLNGPDDGYPGSLFITGHDRQAWGTLPDGDQVAEVSIPVPVVATDPDQLPVAEFLQPFSNVAEGHFSGLDEIPRVGLEYLDHPATGPKIHIAWGQHLQSDDAPSHGWFDPDLEHPNFQGEWRIEGLSPYSTTGYLFSIPQEWADLHTGGRPLATGRMRDGGLGGMGPSLVAYRPWLGDGSAPPDGALLSPVVLLLYENSYNTPDIVRAMNGYQHPDEWEGGAWIVTQDGREAVVFVGTKGTGEKYWYGYIDERGPQYACIDEAAAGDMVVCRHDDGTPCAQDEMEACCDEDAGECVSYRGWWSSSFQAQMIFFDPEELAQVADGLVESWEPQPYAAISLDQWWFLSEAPEWDRPVLGWGPQRRYRTGAAAFDAAGGILYVLELYADGAKPVVHVFKVRSSSGPPVPDLRWEPRDPVPGDVIRFEGSCSLAVDSWDWEMGDGALYSGQVVEHSFGSEGIFEVVLEVSGASGSGSATGLVVVGQPCDLDSDGHSGSPELDWIAEEIFDLDGFLVPDAWASTHAGSEAYDAWGDGLITASDLSAVLISASASP